MLAALRLVDSALSRQLLAIEADLDGRRASAQQPLSFLFQPIILRFKREMRNYEEVRRLWEVTWAMGGTRFFIVLLVAFVRTQRRAVMSLRSSPSSIPDLQRVFNSLVGTLTAAPLLVAARRLHQHKALEETISYQLRKVE